MLSWRIRRILVGVDFGMSSAAALSYAHALAEHCGARLTAVYADEDGRRNGDAATADATLDVFARQALPRDDCERRVIAGPAADVILASAFAGEVDLIVVGSHGRGRMGRWALGSVSAAVLRGARAPVLVVRSAAELFVNGTILVGSDFSAASEAALAAAAALAGPAKATLEVAHVLPLGSHASPGHALLTNDAQIHLDEIREGIVPRSLASRSHAAMAPMGDTARALAAHAAVIDARLIVVGAHGASGVIAGALGGVAERLLRCSAVPVLVVPPREGPSRA